MSGVLSLLKIVKKEKLKIALASSRNETHVKLIINRLGLDKYFNVIVGYNTQVKRKPSPDIFLKTEDNLAINSSTCVVIEDSQSGVVAGKSAGMKVIAVPNKYTMYQDFSKADKIVSSLSEITIPMLKNL